MKLLAIPALAAGIYYVLAVLAGVRWKLSPRAAKSYTPGISVLKPMYGRPARLYEALRSHALADYPQLEILFGIADPADPALEDIARIQREFPSLAARVIFANPGGPNSKAYVLAQLARQARYEVLVVNDDDVVVGRDYFRSVVKPLADAKVGLATCLYRGCAENLPGRVEALGIATEFIPSVLVARLLAAGGFALGATMALRAETLQQIGGFEPITAYLADDYQLGRRVADLGLRVELAWVIVETGLSNGSWRDMWRHQLRWARTIRVSRPGGYYGSLVTHATFWALVAFAAQQWLPAAFALGARLLAAWIVGVMVLEDRQATRWFWLIPLRDLLGLAVWLGGCFGSAIYWRGRRLRLEPDGRIAAV